MENANISPNAGSGETETETTKHIGAAVIISNDSLVVSGNNNSPPAENRKEKDTLKTTTIDKDKGIELEDDNTSMQTADAGLTFLKANQDTLSVGLGLRSESVVDPDKKAGPMISKKIMEAVIDSPFHLFFKDLTIYSELGRGGYGIVLSGRLHGSPVAIKKLHHHSPEIDEFYNEVDILRRLRHPNIVLFLGACISPDPLCIVTELVGRGSLKKIIQDTSQTLTLEDIKRYALDIAKGMNYLHHQNIIHTDLGPSNVLVTDDNACKISDFGLSKFSKDDTCANKGTGTVQYSAPEIYKGDIITVKSDIYSYGMILWELYYRTEPYPDMTNQAICFNVVASNLRPTFDRSNLPFYANIIGACWDKFSELRPSFSEIIKMLKNIDTSGDIEVGYSVDQYISDKIPAGNGYLSHSHLNFLQHDIGGSGSNASMGGASDTMLSVNNGSSSIHRRSSMERRYNASMWSVVEVRKWADQKKIEWFSGIADKHHINGTKLLSLKNTDMVDIGVTTFGHRRMLEIEIQKLSDVYANFKLKRDLQEKQRQRNTVHQVLNQSNPITALTKTPGLATTPQELMMVNTIGNFGNNISGSGYINSNSIGGGDYNNISSTSNVTLTVKQSQLNSSFNNRNTTGGGVVGGGVSSSSSSFGSNKGTGAGTGNGSGKLSSAIHSMHNVTQYSENPYIQKSFHSKDVTKNRRSLGKSFNLFSRKQKDSGCIADIAGQIMLERKPGNLAYTNKKYDQAYNIYRMMFVAMINYAKAKFARIGSDRTFYFHPELSFQALERKYADYRLLPTLDDSENGFIIYLTILICKFEVALTKSEKMSSLLEKAALLKRSIDYMLGAAGVKHTDSNPKLSNSKFKKSQSSLRSGNSRSGLGGSPNCDISDEHSVHEDFLFKLEAISANQYDDDEEEGECCNTNVSTVAGGQQRE